MLNRFEILEIKWEDVVKEMEEAFKTACDIAEKEENHEFYKVDRVCREMEAAQYNARAFGGEDTVTRDAIFIQACAHFKCINHPSATEEGIKTIKQSIK